MTVCGARNEARVKWPIREIGSVDPGSVSRDGPFVVQVLSRGLLGCKRDRAQPGSRYMLHAVRERTVAVRLRPPWLEDTRPRRTRTGVASSAPTVRVGDGLPARELLHQHEVALHVVDTREKKVRPIARRCQRDLPSGHVADVEG